MNAYVERVGELRVNSKGVEKQTVVLVFPKKDNPELPEDSKTQLSLGANIGLKPGQRYCVENVRIGAMTQVVHEDKVTGAKTPMFHNKADGTPDLASPFRLSEMYPDGAGQPKLTLLSTDWDLAFTSALETAGIKT